MAIISQRSRKNETITNIKYKASCQQPLSGGFSYWLLAESEHPLVFSLLLTAEISKLDGYFLIDVEISSILPCFLHFIVPSVDKSPTEK